MIKHIVTYGQKHDKSEIDDLKFGLKGPFVDIDVAACGVPNPHSVPYLTQLTGLHPEVRVWIQRQPKFRAAFAGIMKQLEEWNKFTLEDATLFLHCVGGHHRSPFIASLVFEILGCETLKHFGIPQRTYMLSVTDNCTVKCSDYWDMTVPSFEMELKNYMLCWFAEKRTRFAAGHKESTGDFLLGQWMDRHSPEGGFLVSPY